MLNPVPQHAVLFSVEDFEKMIAAGVFDGKSGRIELIEGELRKISPASDQQDQLIRVLTMWSVRQRYDRFRKGRLYAKDKIREYWIADYASQQIEVYTEPEGEEFHSFEIYARGDSLRPKCLPSAELEIDWLFKKSGV